MDHNSHYLIRAGEEILETGEYNYDAQYLQKQIASLFVFPDATHEFHPTVLSQLRDISHQLSRLLEDPADDADVSLSIYDQNFEIVHISGNERKSLYDWSYGAFRCEIGPRERRLLLLMVQKHPASLKLSDYTRDQVYGAYNTLCEKGLGEVFEIPQKGHLRFKEFSQNSAGQNGDMKDMSGNPENEKMDTNFGSIPLFINNEHYQICKLYEIDTYSISRKGRASTHVFQVREEVIQYIKRFLDGQHTPINAHYNRELEKIGCKLVRKDGKLILEMIPDSPLLLLPS